MMMVRTHSPVARFEDLHREIDRVFSGFLGHAPRGGRTLPAVNLWDAGERLHAEAEVPGMQMSDIEIYVNGNELTIKGRRELPKQENTRYLRRERPFGEFVRSVTLPVDIDADKVEATLKAGVLSITLPKAAAAQPRKIEVKSA